MQLSIDFARAQGESAGNACLDKAKRVADPLFKEKATAAMLRHLEAKGKASGEELTDAAIAHGARPHDARAFGPVFKSLLTAQQIRVRAKDRLELVKVPVTQAPQAPAAEATPAVETKA